MTLGIMLIPVKKERNNNARQSNTAERTVVKISKQKYKKTKKLRF